MNSSHRAQTWNPYESSYAWLHGTSDSIIRHLTATGSSDRFRHRRVICTRSVKESSMLKLIAAAAAAALLSGCGYGYYDHYGYYDRDYYGRDYAYDRYYDPSYDRVSIYYDGYYGPYYDGYWGTDGFFYFSDSGGR